MGVGTGGAETEVVKVGQQAVEIGVFLDEAAFVAGVSGFLLLVNGTDVAQDILVLLARIPPLAVGNDRMHPKLCIFVFVDEVGPHGRRHDVGHLRAPFREVCGEVHLFPTKLLLDLLHAGEPKVLPDPLSRDEVDETIWVSRELLSGSE